jgi:hypothetical protein
VLAGQIAVALNRMHHRVQRDGRRVVGIAEIAQHLHACAAATDPSGTRRARPPTGGSGQPTTERPRRCEARVAGVVVLHSRG